MAFWAMAMFFATLLTVAITAIGVWLVKRTLDETIKAVRETGEATEAMREANIIARESSEHQLRAWLFLDHLRCERRQEGETRWWDLSLIVTNSGQTPAKDVIVKIGWQVTTIPGDDVAHDVVDWPEAKMSGIVAPGAEVRSAHIRLADEQVQDQWISIISRIEYTDTISGAARLTTFRIVAKAIFSPNQDIALRWHPVGRVEAT